jgi:hypothetical protein
MMPVGGLVGLGLLAVIGLTSCGTDTATTETAAPTVTAAPTLPDGIPLPTGGSVVSGPDLSKQSGARGWSAVALARPDADVALISSTLGQELEAQGWVEHVSPANEAGVSITVTRTDGEKSSWLDVNVTPPLPGGGSAVTYRFATGDTLFGKEKKSR